MSRLGEVSSMWRLRFPRVSGDEPQDNTPATPERAFSPRERG